MAETQAAAAGPEAAARLTREYLESRPGEILGRVAWNKPLVRRVDLPEGPVVMKDFSVMAAWLRRSYGKLVLEREARAYRLLAGTQGVPPLIARPDPWVLVVGCVDGVSLGRAPKDTDWTRFFERLDALLRSFHERGLVHLDLRQRKNILVDRAGDPHLIDFSSSLHFPRWFFPLRPVFGLLAWVDRMAVLKFKARKAPGTLTGSERRAARFSELLSILWPFNWLRRLGRRGRE